MTTQSFRRLVSTSLLALMLLFVPTTARAQRADFIFVNRGELGTLDPNRMSWLQDIRIGYALWEGLYALDPQTLNAVPGAAEKIDISLDKLTYTFTLRADGKWSNGDPVLAN